MEGMRRLMRTVGQASLAPARRFQTSNGSKKDNGVGHSYRHRKKPEISTGPSTHRQHAGAAGRRLQ